MPIHARARGFAASVRRAFAALDVAFCKLNRIRFEAPWRPDEPRRC